MACLASSMMLCCVGSGFAGSLQVSLRGEIWCVVRQVAQHVKVVDGLKVNQRVIVLREHVVEIRFHDEKISP